MLKSQRLAIIIVAAFHSVPVVGLEINRESFGLHLHGLKYGVRWPSCSFGAIRLWDSGTQWRQIQPAPSKWDFSALDAYLEQAESQGVIPVLTLGQTPEWAASDPSAASPYARGASSPPADLALWRDYVRKVAERYDGRILHWEVWNEVSAENFWTGSNSEMVDLERAARSVLKSVNQNNLVLSPSFQAAAFDKFDEYLSEGGGRYSDIISYHFYALQYPPEEIVDRIDRVNGILKKHGLANKPLWNTEMGWLLANRDGGFGTSLKPSWEKWRRISFSDSPGVVLQALLLSFSGGIDHVFWYSWNAQQMGLAENRGADPKPAAQAYQAAFDWLVGTQMESCEENAARWVCRVNAGDKLRYIVWATTPEQFTVPADWKVNTLTSYIGESRSIASDGGLLIDAQPVLLSEGAVATRSCMHP